jgi:tRNA(Arg) A34 adenosine deaminase TadA
MRRALALAQAAAEAGEVPVGALVVDPASGEVVAEAGNSPVNACDPTAHAEILAIRAAAERLGNYRLTGLVLYVTLEPCAMCAGAISHARIGRLVYGASDPKGGAIEHGGRFFEQPTCHWRPTVEGGVLADACGEMLRAFFRGKRGHAPIS